MADVKKLHDAILSGDAKTAAAVTQEAIAEKSDPAALINNAMIPAMAEVGRLFECEEYFVPELLLSGRAMKAALELLRPLLAGSGVQPTGRVVIGTVKGDLHDIGKNLVASMLEGGGFEVIDLGADVSPEKFVAAVQERKPHIVCLSALLTVTTPAMKTTIEAIKQAGLRDRVKILVGGAPVTPEYAKEIGADGFAENASIAVSVAKQVCANLPKA
jgi:corrinoid protein of di/trimethylamine methyltransferase